MAKLTLSKVLTDKKISKRQFAKLLGIDYSNVFRFFRPGYDPRLSTVEEWAKVLGVQMIDLFDDVRPKVEKRTGRASRSSTNSP